MKNWLKIILLTFLIVGLLPSTIFAISFLARSGCCSHHSGVCGCECCDGTSLSATCAPYYPECKEPIILSPPLKPIEPIKTKPIEVKETKINYTTLNSTSALVIRVVDGDTIQVKFKDNTIEKVRLIGIDTPETVDPRKPVQCFGKEASAKMKELVENKTVILKKKTDENKDKYSRLLRYVYLDNLFVNAEMIKQGFAYAYIKYPFDPQLMKEFKDYENQAKEKQLGLWASGVCGQENITTTTAKPVQKPAQTQPQNIKQNTSKPKLGLWEWFKKIFFRK